jgi:hypothetical protein
MCNNKLLWWVAILILTVTIHGCTQYVSPLVIKTRQDMDNVVSLKGIPLEAKESFIGGAYPRHTVRLVYPDEMYSFQTDSEKSYTVLLSSHTGRFKGVEQKPIPLWFKAKYPNLNWTAVPTE